RALDAVLGQRRAELGHRIHEGYERSVGVDRHRFHRHRTHRVAPMRHFTPEEANAALAEVRPLVERMVERRVAHAAALERQEELELRIRGNGGGIPPATLADAQAEVEREARELAKLVDEIGEHGAEVKDLDEGLIDFPALRHGETVLLCWQLGEDEIAWWHGVDDGFEGRRPLPLD